MDVQRYLITTADERSWKFDRPVLFLGEWCRVYNRRDLWSGMEAKVAEPFGLGKQQIEKDRLYLRSLKKQLLTELTDSLNNFHNTSHDERYWNIVLGHWLNRYVNVAFNRYFSLEKALKENNISGTAIFNLPDYCLATTNSLDFIWALYDNVWNHVLYSKVLKFWAHVGYELVDLPENEQNSYAYDENPQHNGSTKKVIQDLWSFVFRKLSRNNDAFIINSYLPAVYELKLQLSLGQFPGVWTTPKPQLVPVNYELRNNLKIDVNKFTGFDVFIRSLLIEVIPTCYLEGYRRLIGQTRLLPWPRKPKFIFTSNNFDIDELFKMWTAQKVEEGCKYYIGQHGNNYGTTNLSQEFPEYSISDKFISWGWENGDPKIVPAFIFTTSNIKPQKRLFNGGLLLMERFIYIRLDTYDRYVQYNNYQNEQFRFVDSLSDNIRESLTVRLFLHRLGNMSWCDQERWKDYNSNIQLDSGLTSIWKLIKDNRLTVFSYDSTGFLEMLSLNMPTIGFWNGLFDEILPAAVPYYELLKDAGILAETPEDAASFVTLYWDRLDEWWFSKKVQDARITFCNKYAKTVAKPVKDLKRILI